MTNHTVVKHITNIGSSSTYTIELNVVKWGKNPEKYDIRKWVSGEPLKGICLDQEEATILYYALGKELNLSN